MDGRFTRRNKYGNQPVFVDGHRFASQREARRYGELKVLERAGAIRGLELHPSFPIQINGHHICTYYADFAYTDSGGNRIVEDAKGVPTKVYRLKKRLVRAVHGIEVVEV